MGFRDRWSAVAAVFWGLSAGLVPEAVLAAENSCKWAYDGTCDEIEGLCDAGTDGWDCRRAGVAPGIESCPWSNDGECDEPGGTGACIPYTDTADCRKEGISADATFFGRDDRVWIEPEAMPWSAIGRISFAGGGSCTGTLIAPDVVLTAAHCLYEGEGPGGFDRPLDFRAGAWGLGELATAGIRAYYLPPGFDSDRHSETSEIDGLDWALLYLDAPIGARTGHMTIGVVTADELALAADGAWHKMMQGGYSADSSLFLSTNDTCRVTDIWDDNTFYHECDTLEGDSGSPLFVFDGAAWRVVGIHSAFYPPEVGGYQRNMAVDARAFWHALKSARPTDL